MVGFIEVVGVGEVVSRLSNGWERDPGPGFMHRIVWHEVLWVFCADFVLFSLVGRA